MAGREPWSARAWVEGEIQAQEDSYGNTDEQAAEFVGDLLGEGEYRDELNDVQVRAAVEYLRRRKPEGKQ